MLIYLSFANIMSSVDVEFTDILRLKKSQFYAIINIIKHMERFFNEF